jgi:hypothetical protein
MSILPRESKQHKAPSPYRQSGPPLTLLEAAILAKSLGSLAGGEAKLLTAFWSCGFLPSSLFSGHLCDDSCVLSRCLTGAGASLVEHPASGLGLFLVKREFATRAIAVVSA